MEYREFHGQMISRLGMGTMRLPRVGGKDGAPIDYEAAEQVIDCAYDNGITYYDTAWPYHEGTSESFVGKALVSRHPRDTFALATKFNFRANPDYRYVFETQLERLQTDYIDYYLMHAVMDNSIDSYLTCGCIDYFMEQREKGRIKHLGFSSHATPPVLRRFLEAGDWEFVQIQLNYLDWEYATTHEEHDIIAGAGLPIVVMEPVRGGRLASLTPRANDMLKEAHPDWSIASWAMRWVRTLPQVQTVLSGMTTVEQVLDNVATFSAEDTLSADDLAVLEAARDAFHNELVVPCTACRYCTETCPAGIDIPEVLRLYNKIKMGSQTSRAMIANMEGGHPEDCIGCGLCVSQCPQGIDTPAIMAELTEIPAENATTRSIPKKD